MAILTELKRRNVFKVASVYVITCWLILQIISVIAPALHLPTMFSTIVTVVLAIGLPVACIFAWAFELTPQGLKFTHHVDVEESIRHETGNKINKLLLLSLILALLFIAYDKFLTTSFDEDIEISIAVLPFEDMSANNNQAYFGEGIAEEIINTLTRVDKLMVISRTSSFSFKNTNADIAKIGNTLNVNFVLEGSVRKDGDKLRITAQLIDVQKGNHIWSESYDRTLDSVFEVQDELTFAITKALQLNLLPEELNFEAGMTTSPQAYELFIQARELGYQRTPEALQRAAELLKQAIAIDPVFYLAKAQLYSVYHLSGDYGGFETSQRIAEQEHLFWGLMSAPTFPLKQVVIGLHAQKRNELETAMLLFDKAYKSAPNETFIQNIYLLNIPDMELAIEARLDALRSNPESEVNYSNLIYLYDYIGDTEAAQQLRIDMQSKFPNSKLATRSDLFIHYSKEQDINETLAYLKTYSGEITQHFNRFKAGIYLISGNIDEALLHLDKVLTNEPENQAFLLGPLVLLQKLQEQDLLNESQTTKALSLPVSTQTKTNVSSFLALLKGNELPFAELHQLQDLGPEEFMQKMEENDIKSYLYAAIKKAQGDDRFAKVLSAKQVINTKFCEQSAGRIIWCPLYMYVDGSFSEQQQFEAFQNSLTLLNEAFIGEEMFMLSSPIYYGVRQHPEFSATADRFLDSTFRDWGTKEK